MCTFISAYAHFRDLHSFPTRRSSDLGNSSTGQGAADIAATAPTSGTYTVIVGSYLSGYYDGTGSYLLTLAKRPGAHAAALRAHRDLVCSLAMDAGSIYLGDLDTWTFT